MSYFIIFYIISVIICRELNIQAVKQDGYNPNIWILCLIPILNCFGIIVLFCVVSSGYFETHKIEFKIIKWFRGDYRI